MQVNHVSASVAAVISIIAAIVNVQVVTACCGTLIGEYVEVTLNVINRGCEFRITGVHFHQSIGFDLDNLIAKVYRGYQSKVSEKPKCPHQAVIDVVFEHIPELLAKRPRKMSRKIDTLFSRLQETSSPALNIELIFAGCFLDQIVNHENVAEVKMNSGRFMLVRLPARDDKVRRGDTVRFGQFGHRQKITFDIVEPPSEPRTTFHHLL